MSTRDRVNVPELLLERLDEVLEAIATQQGALKSTTAELAQWRNLAINGVLFVGVATFDGTAPAIGHVSLTVGTPFGGVAVWNNLGAGLVTVQSGGPSDTVPALPSGGQAQPGRLVIPGGGFVCAPLVGRTLTLYGLAGAAVNVVLTVNPYPPGA